MESKMKHYFISKYASYTTKVEIEKEKYVVVEFEGSSYATNDDKIAAAIRRHPYFGIEIYENKVQPKAETPAEQPKVEEKPAEEVKPETPAAPAEEAKPAAAKKTFQCDKCKSKFASQTALEAHIATMHS
jgi:hypothetical protein